MMMMMMTLDNLALLLSLFSTIIPPASASSRPQKILLSDVQILTLRGNGAFTAHRRVPSIPQLKCIASDAICDLFSIDIMRCTNQGSSYGAEDIEWSCVAELPAELRLSSADVICEGFQDAEDPYVLRGSCGVEYVLALTELGEDKYPEIAHPPPPAAAAAAAAPTPAQPWFNNGEGGEDYSAWLFSIIFVAVCGLIIYSACFAKTDRSSTQDPPKNRGRMTQNSDPHDPHNDDDVLHDEPDRRGIRRGSGGTGGWNPGWGPSRGPPPPYSDERRDSYHPFHKRDHDNIDYAYTRQRGWTPGFWSGLAGGSAAGYVAGRTAANNNHNNNNGSNSNIHSGARTRTRNDDFYRSAWDDGPAIPRPSSSARSPSAHQPFNSTSASASTSKSDRHESIGFGSTRRR